jgi:hypothetical protein
VCLSWPPDSLELNAIEMTKWCQVSSKRSRNVWTSRHGTMTFKSSQILESCSTSVSSIASVPFSPSGSS